jgi:gas vesicle protein
MAERPGELDEVTEIKVSRTDQLDRTNDSFSDTNLENRSTGDVDGSSGFNTDTDVTTDETEKIRTEIVETRSQMSETIDAIQEKLSFANISEQVSSIGDQVKDEVSEHISSAIQTAKDSVYDATLGKVGNIMNYVNKGINELAETDMGHTVRRNPLAVGLIGLGLGLLFMNSNKKLSKYRYNRNENDYDFDYNYDREGDYQNRRGSSRNNQSTFAVAQNKVGDVAGRVGETVSGAAGAVSETVSGVAGSVTDVAGKAYKQVGDLGSQVKDVADSAQDQYEYYIEENPLAVGAVALALGAAVGMSIPSTRFEGQLMGETRNNLMQKAEETARETIDKVKNVAGEVTEKVRNVAGEVAQTVKDSAGDVTQPIKDEAKNQGLT